MTSTHTFVYTFGEDLVECFFKDRFLKKLSCPADSAVPWQFFIDIQEEEDIHSHGSVIDELAITDEILQIAQKADLEARMATRQEDHGIDGFLAVFAIIWFGAFIQKLKVDSSL